MQLSESYGRVYQAVIVELVKDYVPPPWVALIQVFTWLLKKNFVINLATLSFIQVKREYYKACAHHLVGRGLHLHRGPLSVKTQETLRFIYGVETDVKPESKKSTKQLSTIIDIRVPKDDAERQQLGEKMNEIFHNFLLEGENWNLKIKMLMPWDSFLLRAVDLLLRSFIYDPCKFVSNKFRRVVYLVAPATCHFITNISASSNLFHQLELLF